MTYKILAYADAGMNTGFERVARNVLTHLHNTGHYEIIQYGLGWVGNPDFDYPYKVYPAAHHGEYFGFDGLPKACERHKPDLIWSVQDLWHHTQYIVRKPVDIPYMAYFPVDTPNMKWSYGIGTGAISCPVAYTEYGAMETAASVRDAVDLLYAGAKGRDLPTDEKRQWVSLPHPESNYKMNCRLDYLAKWQNMSEWAIIPHGLDHKTFFPADKAEARAMFELDQDAFIVGNINTNQFRKRHDQTIRIFAMLAAKMPNARLLLHCNGNNENGLDLHQVAQYYGVHKKTYFVHDYAMDMDDASLNMLYNACDVMINTAGGEGWGLTSIEGGACGVPQLVPDWSATREIWKDHGILLPVQGYRMKEGFLNTCLADLDIKRSGELLIDLATNPDKLALYRQKSLALAAKQLSWAEVGKKFEWHIRKTIANFKEPEFLTMDEVVAARQGVVESELKNVVYIENGKLIKV